MDTHTLQTLLKRSPSRPPHVFAPLGNMNYFKDLGVKGIDKVAHCMDWWDEKRVEIEVPVAGVGGSFGSLSSPCSGLDLEPYPLTPRSFAYWNGSLMQYVITGERNAEDRL
jgi:hypothetical protein